MQRTRSVRQKAQRLRLSRRSLCAKQANRTKGVVRLAMASALELERGAGHQLALVARDGELLGGRLPRAVAAGNGGSAVGRAAVGLGNIEELADAIARRHDDHSVVGQRGPG